jgi:hypothetical protein
LGHNLHQALQTLDIQLVSGGAQLLKSVEAFAERFDLVWPVTPRDLADTLHVSLPAWSPKLPKYFASICDPILQFFSSEDALKSLQSPEDNRTDTIRALPLFPCQNNELVAIKDHRCFIAADVWPPAISLPIKLLRSGLWKDLLAGLDVKPLATRAIIEDVLLPNYATLAAPQQIIALAWIRDHLEAALTEAGDESDKLLGVLQSAQLVFGSDDKLHACDQLYVPHNETIKNVLGDQAITPKLSLYESDWKRWLPFFERLAINQTPRPQDLALYIQKLAKTDPLTEQVEDNLTSLLHHIVDHWSDLREGQINLTNGQRIAFKDFLRREKWCPPLRGSTNLRHLLVAPDPPMQLFHLTELYPPSVGHLVGSLKHLLPLRAEQREGISTAVREIIPEVVNPPLSVVTNHFSNLLAKLNGQPSPDRKSIKTPLQRIYSYFGRLYRRSQAAAQQQEEHDPDGEPVRAVDDSEFDSVQKQFAETECIYVDSENRFRKPRDVFQEAVPFASPWWSQSYFGVREVEAGLAFLGRKEKPEFADLCRLTCEIRAAHEEGFKDEEAAQFIHILFRIEELLPENDPLPELCLLDRDNCPVRPDSLFFHDAIWLDDKLTDSPAHLHHPQIPPKLISRLKLRRLSEHIEVEPAGEWPEPQDSAFVERCKSTECLLKSPEFNTGLRRILLKESHFIEADDLAWLGSIQLQPYQSLECSHYILDGEKRYQIARAEELFFHELLDSGNHALSVSEAASEVLCEQIATAIQRILPPGLLNDLSPLTKILQYAPERIEAILNKLRIPQLIEAERPPEDDDKTQDGKSEFFDTDESQEQSNKQTQTGTTGSSSKSKPTDTTTGGGDDATPLPGGEPAGSGTGRGSYHPCGQRSWSGRKRTSTTKPRPKPKGRLISYPATAAQKKEKELEEDHADDELLVNREIGNWAVHWVLQYERQHDRNPDPSAHKQNTPGFDILSREKCLKPPRYIEVKGIDGDWDIDGVPLSPRQLDFARDKRDQFWLYVVEHARDPALVKIHPIQNLNAQVTQFRFDHGWKQLADRDTNFKPLQPAVGLRIRWYHDNQPKSGVITSIGKMLQVRLDNGHQSGIANQPLTFEILPS